MKDKERLLIVDDEPDMLSLLKRTISRELDWEIMTTTSAKKALDLMEQTPADLALLDIKMPGMDGIEMLTRIKEKNPSPAVVMMTAYGVIELAVESIKKGAYDFITKPFDDTRLILTLRKAREYHHLFNENRALQRLVERPGIFQHMVGEAPKMKKVFEAIQTVSKTDATVLITGESGTGKELAARAIHRFSLRNKKPFVTVNCPTLPENILETELFGYSKGAFTDAKQDKKGLFQEADGGTIFLDEIGELPINLQTKLLRVLQEKEIKPLGQSRSIKVDVRVVASTNRNLKAQMSQGDFREDLYYRLKVVSIEIPPLRERPEDIPLLVERFLKKYGKKFGREGLALAPGFIDGLCRNPWHGNVRELENAMKRAIIMAKGLAITLSDLDWDVEDECLVSGDVKHLPYREAKEQVLTSFNREYLTSVLSDHQGNVTHAAKTCGLERQALQQILRRYSIKAQDFRKPAH